MEDDPAGGDSGALISLHGVRVRVPELEVGHVQRRPQLREASPVRGHPGGPPTLSRRGLQPDAAAQRAGARNHGRGEAAGQQLGAPGAQELPPGHAGLPLLALCARVPGEAHLPVPLAVRGRAGRLLPHHGVVWLPLAGDAHL